jgi:hypothetical protein
VPAGASRLARALAALLRGLAAQAPIRAVRSSVRGVVSATATRFVERELGLRPPPAPKVRSERRPRVGRSPFDQEVGRLQQQVGTESTRLQHEVVEEAARLQEGVDEEARRLQAEAGAPIDRWQLGRPASSRRELLKLRRRSDPRGAAPRGREP